MLRTTQMGNLALKGVASEIASPSLGLELVTGLTEGSEGRGTSGMSSKQSVPPLIGPERLLPAKARQS